MKIDARLKVILSIIWSVLIIGLILILSCCLDGQGLNPDASLKNMAPSSAYLFGTDGMGRDMLVRTTRGLRFSLFVGIIGAVIGVFIAILLGICAAIGSKIADKLILWTVDMFIGMPHLIFMILISFVAGKGAKGVIIATAITHWPALARVIRNEVYNIKNTDYIKLSKNMGKSSRFIVTNHILPVIFPQIFIGFILLFPHVILHEASMTFLGFGLSAQQPSIGIILSEAAKHISLGNWWLVVLPGLSLILLVKCFDIIGESLRKLYSPQMKYM